MKSIVHSRCNPLVIVAVSLGYHRRARLYERCLDIVECRIESELIINPLVLAEMLHVTTGTIQRILQEHKALGKIIYQYQVIMGTQRIRNKVVNIGKKFHHQLRSIAATASPA